MKKAGRVLAGWLAAVAVGVGAQEVPLRETPQGKLFGTERFAVRLDPQTGWAGDVLCDGRPVVLAPGTKQIFDLRQDEKWVTGGGAAVEGLGVDRVASDTVRSRMRAGEWTVDAYVQLFPEGRLLRRWFEIAWQGAADTKIKAFWIQGGELPLGDGGGYFIPAQYPPRRVAAGELVANRKSSSGRSPNPIIGETGGGWSAVWVSDERVGYADRGGAGAQEGEGRIRVTQSFNMLGHMRRGAPQKVGDAWLWLQPNDGETALRRMGEWFRLVGQVPPGDRPDWLKRVVLYSFHPGGTIGSGCKDLGGFQAATALLPHIWDLGCNAIWLMPLEDKSIYWPRDYYKFQEGLGTGDDYKALTAKAHGLGMRVWQDCVPHGGGNQFQRAKDHPEWLAQNEDGSTLDYWCFDFNWPTWIDYMSNVVTHYTREYSLDGFRIDAVSGSKIPNWNPAIPYARASHAQAQGGLAMQRALRQAVKAIRPDGANLAEAGESIHGAVSDSTYDFDLCYHVLHDFRKLPAEAFVPKLRRWLHEQSYAEVPDLVRMRHVESHDSLRSGLWYGCDAQRALVALISWIHGIPMVYHEMEDGHFDAYRRIFHVRHCVAELNAGAADYLSVAAPDGVFACLRTGAVPEKTSPAWSDDYAWDTAPKGGARASVVLVNLSGKPVRGTVAVPDAALPEALRGTGWARDLTTGEKVKVRQGAMEVALPPFGYTVLRLASRELPELAPAPLPEPAKRAEGAADGLEVGGRSGTLLVDPATGLAGAWRAGGVTLAAGMDLALPAELAAAGAKAACVRTGGTVEATRTFGSHTLKLRYARAGEGVEVRAAWEGGVPAGAALLLDLPAAQRWFAATAEGVFESPFRVRHPGFDGAVGSIYRLPQGTATVWDSRLHPFGLDEAHARVGAVSGRRSVSLGFDPARLPASVQVLDRAGDDPGMKVLVAWRNDERDLAAGGDELVFTLRSDKGGAPAGDGGTGDARLAEAGGGWVFENAHYRARVGRNGTLAGLWRRDGGAWRQVAGRSAIYTDRGFAEDKRMSQEDDVEATARIERQGGALKLSFCGELRGFYRFDKMARPVRFASEYVFGEGPAFRRVCAFSAEAAPSGSQAFLSLITTGLDGVERASFADGAGEFLAGERGDGKARYAQTAKSAEPGRVPGDIRLSGPGGMQLRLSDLSWFGARPANVFLHGRDLHLAWLDGKPDCGGLGRWSGVSMSVSCGEDGSAAAVPVPWAAGVSERPLLQDGGFEAASAGNGLALARSGRPLPAAEGDVRRAWQLPKDAAVTTAGGSRCVTVVGDGQEYRMVRQALPPLAFPAGSVWRLSARLKGERVEAGDPGWKTACLRWALFAGGRTSFATASLPVGDSDWREVAVEMTVPEGLTGLSAEVGLNGNRGRIWADDLRVERVDRR